MRRREYGIELTVNARRIHKVIIDPHYELKHRDSIDDAIILRLVQTLDGEMIEPVQETPPFSYFATDEMELEGKLYKLVWLLEASEAYIGVLNAYRRK